MGPLKVRMGPLKVVLQQMTSDVSYLVSCLHPSSPAPVTFHPLLNPLRFPFMSPNAFSGYLSLFWNVNPLSDPVFFWTLPI